MRLPAFLTTAGLLGAAAQAAYYYPRLPDRMASHFGAGGAVDGWQTKAAFFQLYGLILTVVLVSLLGLPLLIGRLSPSLINIPYRDYWLTPERRDEAMRRLQGALLAFAAAVVALLVGTMQLVFEANLRPDPRLDGVFVWMLGAFFAFVAGWLVWLYRVRFRPPAPVR